MNFKRVALSSSAASLEIYMSPFAAKVIPSGCGNRWGEMGMACSTFPFLSVITSSLPIEETIYNLFWIGWIAAAEGRNSARLSFNF